MKSPSISPGDVGTQVIDASSAVGGGLVDPEKTWRKIDCRIIPMMAILVLMCLIDETNIGNARIAGLQRDLKITNHQFSILVLANTIPDILLSLPMSLAMKEVGPNIMLSTKLTLWAIVATLQGITKSYRQLLICRVFLGLLASGFFPSVFVYLSLWYPRQHLQKRISAFLAITSAANAFSGIFAYGIVRLDGVGHIPGWAWIFILEGLFSFLCGLLAFFLLPRSPRHAHFLCESEKEYVINQLQISGAIDRDEQIDSFNWRDIGQALFLPHVWMFSVLSFLMGIELLAIVYFFPSIVAGLGYNNIQTQIYTVPPVAAAIVCMLVSSYLSDRFSMRGFVIAVSHILISIGLTMFLTAGSLHIKYGSLFLITCGLSSVSPSLSVWLANNTAPYTRRATASSFTGMMIGLGGIVSTLLLGTFSSPPLYTTATITLLIISLLIILITGIMILYFWSQNRKKLRIREKGSRNNEKPGLGDRSAWFIYSL